MNNNFNNTLNSAIEKCSKQFDIEPIFITGDLSKININEKYGNI